MKDWRDQLKAIKGDLASKKEDSPSSAPRQANKNVLHNQPVRPPLNTQRRSQTTTATNKPSGAMAGREAASVRPRQLAPVSKPQQIRSQPQTNAARPLLEKPAAARPTPAQVAVAAKPKAEPAVPVSFRSIKPSALTRQWQYVEAPDWVEAGRQLSLGEERTGQHAIDVFIGVDFGTSYTKAAVGLMDAIFPVRWDGVHCAEDALTLPTEYSVMEGNRAVLGQHPSATRESVLVNLKHPFLMPAVSRRSTCEAAVFLALVIQYVRAWTYKEHGDLLRHRKVNWMVNLGTPSNGLEDDQLKIAYLRLVHLAWQLSLLEHVPGRVDADSPQVSAWMNDRPKSLLDEPGLIPEFQAQIAGYVQSSQRADGLHCLVDVGGGSLDVVTFSVIQRDGEDRFPIWAPEVKPLGVHMLLQNRLLGAQMPESTQVDPIACDLEEAAFVQQTGMQSEKVRARDRLFEQEVEQVVRAVVARTKTKRYKLSPAWANGLRVFMAGGGAVLPQYLQPVDRGVGHVAQRVNMLDIPRHNKVAEHLFPPGTYHRISVACGLAQDRFNFGPLTAAKDIEDDAALGTVYVRPRADRDELYAK
ncbi:MAG: hypothetical protein HY019_03270 [Aquabacterium sp.]|uniref:hypothetical protein n=1 Tax=Aquabacterium sp. TaxID=1872578 RepID=UPI0025B98CCA|nr:hypothetical protein [Aquabacterium sp.]MBI3381006.1 hypothetical protein [Aquabacterium sp.]